MDLHFDISEDERPLFLAETEEHLQSLEQGLIHMERYGEDAEVVQQLFRAAHTLKGMSGMIGHKRMVSLTHALENVLDAIRNNQIQVDSTMIDLALEALDILRSLREEVIDGRESPVDVIGVTSQLAEYLSVPNALNTLNQKIARQQAELAVQTGETTRIEANISQYSMASAARAYQIILAMEKMGKITYIEPSQAVIETAAPVYHLIANVETDWTAEKIREEIASIDEIDTLLINGEGPRVTGAGFHLRVGIAPDSVASAARAFQVLLALENLGKITELIPTREVIESAKPVEKMEILFQSENTAQEIKKSLEVVDEIQVGSIEPVDLANFNLSQPAVTTVADKDHPANGDETKKAYAAEAEKNQAGGGKSAPEKVVRTSVEKLDILMNLVGELITDRNRLNQIRNQFEMLYRSDGQVEVLSESVTHIGRITDQLQKEVMSIRMLPVGNVFNKFPRVVRDLANKFGKKLDLIIEGEDTELDRSVIEEINDPLIHLVRNAIDHGVEPPEERLRAGKPERAKVYLTARHEQGRIILTVEDDGQGIDSEKMKKVALKRGLITEADAASMSDDEAINLIFASGFSTASKVSDISGRGVGMDIVRNNIQRLSGSIMIDTTQGEGTRFQIVLPLTLAIVPTLLVKTAHTTLAIPLVTVLSTLRITDADIKTVNNRPVIVLREKVLPLLEMADVIDVEKNKELDHRYVVVIGSGKLQLGLMVDRLIGQEEVVVKSLGPLIGEVIGIASAAILGDGNVILIADVQDLFRLAGLMYERQI